MMRFACLLWFMTLAAGCVLEDKPVDPQNDGGAGGGVDAGPDAGMCGNVTCPADQPVCTDELECVQCTADEDEYCTERNLTCDIGSSTCIECSGDQDCRDPDAARCDQGFCMPCNEDGQCVGIGGLGTAGNACFEGECVDCTPETEGDSCPTDTTCDPRTKKCTQIRVGALDVCEECVADNQCGDGGEASVLHRCVPMFYPNDETRFPDEDTGFCLKSTQGGCVQPYSVTLTDRESLSGEPADDYCGIREELATCPAVNALVNGLQCPSGDALECPQPSGLCEQVGDLPNRCTYLCGTAQQCLDIGPEPQNPNPGSSCDSSGTGGAGGAGGDYCGG